MNDKPTAVPPANDCTGPAKPYIPFMEAMRPLLGKWKIEILWTLSHSMYRFGELKRALPGITQHMLTNQLKELEADGLVKRTAYEESPPRVEYEATEAAFGLRPVILAFLTWSEQHGPLSRQSSPHWPIPELKDCQG